MDFGKWIRELRQERSVQELENKLENNNCRMRPHSPPFWYM